MLAGPTPQSIPNGGCGLTSWLIVLWCLTALFLVWWFIRDNRVYRFRMHLIDRIHQAIGPTPTSWKWRYDEFGRISYARMFWSFWKPPRVEAFYNKDPAREQP